MKILHKTIYKIKNKLQNITHNFNYNNDISRIYFNIINIKIIKKNIYSKIIYFKIIYLILAIGIIFFSSPYQSKAYADLLYSGQDCKFGTDEDINVPETQKMMGINSECYSNCSNHCSQVYGVMTDPLANTDPSERLDEYPMGAQTEKAYEIAGINKDNIINCINTCVSGHIYQGEVRKYNEDSSKYAIDKKVSTSWHCIANAEPDSLYFSINPKSQNLNDNAASQTNTTNLDKITLYLSTEPEILLDSVEDNLYTSYSPYGRKSIITENNSHGGWNAFNKYVGDNENWSDTGLDIRDGDTLSISYRGRYYGLSSFNGELYKPDNPRRYDLEIKIGDKTGVLKGSSFNLDIFTKPMNPDDDPVEDVIEDPNISLWGLKGMLGQAVAPSIYKEDLYYKNKSCEAKSPKSKTKYNSCYNDNFFPMFTFRGVLENVSKDTKRLYIRYSDQKNKKEDNINHFYGGFYVDIDWKGRNIINPNTDKLDSSIPEREVILIKSTYDSSTGKQTINQNLVPADKINLTEVGDYEFQSFGFIS